MHSGESSKRVRRCLGCGGCLLGVGVLAALVYGLFFGGFGLGVPLEDPLAAEILEAYRAGQRGNPLEITYPPDGTLFPPEIVAPTFCWKHPQAGARQAGARQAGTPRAGADAWAVGLEFGDEQKGMSFLATDIQWTPLPAQWEAIKRRCLERKATVTVVGVRRAEPKKILSAASITISTSSDEVGAPIFYREVNLPFIDAVKDPSRIRWRFGTVSSPEQPPVVLEELPVCGNCHSFSADGKTLAMDVDYANNQGSYVMTRVAREMVLATSEIITWNDYRKEDGERTFGLLSQVSPDGGKVYNRADIRHHLGMALYLTGKFPEAAVHLSEAARLDPDNAGLQYSLALTLAALGKIDEPLEHYSRAVQLQPEVDKSATPHHFLGINYAKAGRLHEAVLSAQRAIKLARDAGAEDLALQIEQQVQRYQRDLGAKPN